MIVVIRISGQVGLNSNIAETLKRINIHRKYSATLLKDTTENKKLVLRLRNNVAYGKISDELAVELIEKRGQFKDSEKDAKKAYSDLQKKSFNEIGLKPFFRLHPPRGGIESKKHFGVGKGVLGDQKDNINDLLRRML